MGEFSVGSRRIGPEQPPCFVIAECGVNHNGNVEAAKAMIDDAAQTGGDAVKFQIWGTGNSRSSVWFCAIARAFQEDRI
jgi:sialic acid synthase SpsE